MAPPVRALGETAQLLNARPALVAQRALAGQLSARAPVQRAAAPNRTGLPDRLKAGVEALSGIAMDDVRVHRNSSRPAQLEAHAYAQGTDIHLAPGQERHLPHEAWHVVQQKQGRVRATMQMKEGVPVNDDAGLEAEADRMGARAMSAAGAGAPHQLMHDRATSAAAPVQRETKYYGRGESLEKDVRKKVLAIVARLDREVDWATRILQGDPTLSSNKTLAKLGYVRPWVTAYKSLLAKKKIPPFFYARYGYAVEALASSRMPKASQGLTILTQYSAGATRPDFVVQQEGQDLAWLDITAAASVGHIRNKQHSGWSSRPVVAEVLYEAPSATSFSTKGLTQEQKESLEQISKDAEQAEEDFDTGEEHLAVVVEEALDNGAGEGQLSAGAAADIIHEAIKEALSPVHKETGDITRKDAAQVLRSLQHIRIRKQVSTGASWAGWAFPTAGASYKRGRELVIALGTYLRGRRFNVPDDQDVL